MRAKTAAKAVIVVYLLFHFGCFALMMIAFPDARRIGEAAGLMSWGDPIILFLGIRIVRNCWKFERGEFY